ncbi:MAG: 4-hydroxy-tetrahydrodipicolinate reductase [Mariprofundales bacterium]|nr:4-hydroxy-tetrahydrodipicolinate reductase [Mariprofundales bacterium]
MSPIQMDRSRIAIVGAGGRMGRMLIQAVTASEHCTLAAATEREGSPHLGNDAATLVGVDALGITVREALSATDGIDTIIDFTTPHATLQHAKFAAEHGIAMVIGTTGLDDAGIAQLHTTMAAQSVVMAPNFSVGINLALQLAERTAATLGEEYDAEILETHHRHKMDAPSGTALALGQAVAAGRGIDFSQRAVYARHGLTGPRNRGDIGFAVMRAGSVVGDHATFFISDEEQIEIRHVAHDRMVFAKGAVRAANWLATQQPGWYTMANVLGF